MPVKQAEVNMLKGQCAFSSLKNILKKQEPEKYFLNKHNRNQAKNTLVSTKKKWRY